MTVTGLMTCNSGMRRDVKRRQQSQGRQQYVVHVLGVKGCCGVQACRPGATLVAIHDSARPLVRQDDVQRCMADALEVPKPS